MPARPPLTFGFCCLALSAAVAGPGARFAAASAPYASRALREATGARFTFTGSLRGTLVLAPNHCDGPNREAAQFYFNGTLAGIANGPEVYSVAIAGGRSGGGTYIGPFPTPDGGSVTLEASINAVNYVWEGATGRFTIKAGTGNLAVGLVPDPKPAFAKPGRGRVHISGAWDCPGS